MPTRRRGRSGRPRRTLLGRIGDEDNEKRIPRLTSAHCRGGGSYNRRKGPLGAAGIRYPLRRLRLHLRPRQEPAGLGSARPLAMHLRWISEAPQCRLRCLRFRRHPPHLCRRRQQMRLLWRMRATKKMAEELMDRFTTMPSRCSAAGMAVASSATAIPRPPKQNSSNPQTSCVGI